MTPEEKKERPISMINEASNYNMTSDYAAHPMSPIGRVSYFAYCWVLIAGVMVASITLNALRIVE